MALPNIQWLVDSALSEGERCSKEATAPEEKSLELTVPAAQHVMKLAELLRDEAKSPAQVTVQDVQNFVQQLGGSA